MTKRIAVATLLAAVCLFARAQERPLAPEERRQLAEIVPYLLETLYVSPEKGKELATAMRAAFAGELASAKTASELAKAIDAALASANDRHLGMGYSAADDAAPVLTVAAWKQRVAAAGGGPMMRVPDRDQMRLMNFGVVAAEVLPGNVGYLRVRQFVDGDDAQAAMAGAMAFLANTDAMIVDVRGCPGGSAGAVAYLASYFFGPEERVLMNRFHRPSGRSMQSTTVKVAGARRPEVDLYVLTGADSGSACESFAFSLQQWGRAKTVGEKTAGAGNNNTVVDVGLGLKLSISTGSAVHGKTGKGFEGVGVVPDLAAPAARAREVAHAEALRGIEAKAKSDAQKNAVRAALRTTTGGSSEQAIAEVRLLERAWLDAYEKRDAAAMNRIVADDFVIVHSDGSTQTKADVLAMLARGAASGMPGAKFTTDDVQARAYGETVILTGRVTMEMTRRDGTTARREARYTDAYARTNGRWQVVSSHQGRIGD